MTFRGLHVPTSWNPLTEEGRGFIDRQVEGPYAFWRHTHRFIETEDGTWIEDDVEYALPFGWANSLLHKLFVQPRLATIFDYRARSIDGLFNRSRVPFVQPSGRPAV